MITTFLIVEAISCLALFIVAIGARWHFEGLVVRAALAVIALGSFIRAAAITMIGLDIDTVSRDFINMTRAVVPLAMAGLIAHAALKMGRTHA